MKLVDILALELKVWPEGLECLSQLKGTGYIINGKGFDGRAFDALRIADETLVAGAIVTRAEWQAAVDALNAPKVVDWDEFGFPPAGVSCEFTSNDGYNWKPCRILYADELSILTGELEGKADRRLLRKCDADVKFRPARTAEQVAAEEREKARTEVLNAMTANGKTANEPEALWQFRLKVVGEMLDMGYRKDTKPCGS